MGWWAAVAALAVAACGGGGSVRDGGSADAGVADGGAVDGGARVDGGVLADGGAAGPARVLVVTHTAAYRHDSIPVAEQVIEAWGRDSGLWTTRFCRTADDVRVMLTPAALASVDAVVFANTSGELGLPDLDGFLAWVRAGGGFVGIHAASDTYHAQPAYLQMLGGEFDRHGDQTRVRFFIENPRHPAVAGLGEAWEVLDEIYRLRGVVRAEVTPLLSLDRAPDDGLPDANTSGDFILAWAKAYGAGRVFYTALGHRIELWQDRTFQQHIHGGIRSVLPTAPR